MSIKPMSKKALTTAAQEAPSGGYEVFVFYYAGHGDSDGSVVFYDREELSPAALISLVKTVPARIRLVILDSCYSGNFVTEAPTVSPYPDDYTGTTVFSYPFSFTLIEKAATAYSSSSDGNLIALSAAGADELSEESATLAHGIFTAGLLKSADSGDANGDGLVTLTEAYNYAANFVQTEWNAKHSSDSIYLPRLSGNALDVVLFK